MGVTAGIGFEPIKFVSVENVRITSCEENNAHGCLHC